MKETLKDIFINNPQYDNLRSTAIGGTLGGLAGGLYGYFRDYDHYKDLDDEEEKDERLKSALLHTGLGTGTGILSGMVFDLQPRYFLGYGGYKDYLKTLDGVTSQPGRKLQSDALNKHWNTKFNISDLPGLSVLKENYGSATEFVGNGPAYLARLPKLVTQYASQAVSDWDPYKYIKLTDTAEVLHRLFPKSYPTVEAAKQSIEWSNKFREALDSRNLPSFKPIDPGLVLQQYRDNIGPHAMDIPIKNNVDFIGANLETPEQTKNSVFYNIMEQSLSPSNFSDSNKHISNGFKGISNEDILNSFLNNDSMLHEVGHVQSAPNEALLEEFYKDKVFNPERANIRKSLYHLLQGSYPEKIAEYTRTFDLINHYAKSLGLNMTTTDLPTLRENYKKAFNSLLQAKNDKLPLEHKRLRNWIDILKSNLHYEGIYNNASNDQLFDIWFSTLPNESLPSIGYGNSTNLQKLMNIYL